ncbi:MAG: rod-binding protein [Nitrospirota bacterium]
MKIDSLTIPIDSIMLSNKVNRLKAADDNSMKKAADEFESFLISYMLKEMRNTIPESGLFSGGRGEEIYRSLLDDELAKNMVERGGLNISKSIIQGYK